MHTLLKAVGLTAMLFATATPQDQKVFRSDTRLVEADVVVRDGKGPVEGLTVADFELFDNGKPQKIAAFSVIASRRSATKSSGLSASAPAVGLATPKTEMPVTATVLFINNLTIPFADQVQSRQRMAEVMAARSPREPIAIYSMNSDLQMRTDFTSDPVRIANTLAAFGFEQPRPGGLIWIPPVYAALQEVARRVSALPGRKNLIWIANFFPVCAPETICYPEMLRTINVLNAANMAVYPISADGVAGPALYSSQQSKAPPQSRNPSRGKSVFDGIFWAEKTGGDAAQNTDVGNAMQRALDDSQVTYSLGYYPESQDGSYHELTVKVDRKGVDVRSRQGYLSPSPQP